MEKFTLENCKVLILLIGFIPRDNYEVVTKIVAQNLKKIRQQKLNCNMEYDIIYADDGSEAFDEYCLENNFNIIDNRTTDIPIGYSCDKYIITPRRLHGRYAKSEIINFVAKEVMLSYSHMILLDDDHEFLFDDALINFAKYFSDGFEFIIGRIIDPNGTARHYLDNTVQGSTLGLSKELLNKITPLTTKITEWGAGEDSVIFHEVWRNKPKSLYAGEIVSVDRLSKRWAPSKEILDRITANFHTGFMKFYGLMPLEIPARTKSQWVIIENGSNEKYFSIANSSDVKKIYRGTHLFKKFTFFKLKIIWFFKNLFG